VTREPSRSAQPGRPRAETPLHDGGVDGAWPWAREPQPNVADGVPARAGPGGVGVRAEEASVRSRSYYYARAPWRTSHCPSVSLNRRNIFAMERCRPTSRGPRATTSEREFTGRSEDRKVIRPDTFRTFDLAVQILHRPGARRGIGARREVLSTGPRTWESQPRSRAPLAGSAPMESRRARIDLRHAGIEPRHAGIELRYARIEPGTSGNER
jgi:hypothetical protein